MTETSTSVLMNVSDAQHGRYLTFQLDKEVFGIEIKYVTQIVGIQKICSLPESPEFVKGVINLRGTIIPVIDMRLRLRKEPAPYTERTCIIVIDLSHVMFGLIVDCVNEVALIDDQNIVPPPEFKNGSENRYIQGIGKTGEEIRLLLDCERLFETEELESFIQIDK